jgi:phage FluMu gp28-like protein
MARLSKKTLSRPPWLRLTQLMRWGDMAPLADLCGYTPHARQLEIHQDRSRFRTVCCGRRFGKSELAAFEAICTACLGGHVLLTAPTYDLAAIVWEKIVQRLVQSQLQSQIVHFAESEGAQIINLLSGGRIYLKTSSKPIGLLGRGPDLVIGDEWAKEPDPEVFGQYIRPSLMDNQGGAILISTPNGDDHFKDAFDRGRSGRRGWASFQFSSHQNPHLRESELEDIIEDLSERELEQEILAQFLEGRGTVFRGYRDAATSLWQEQPVPGHIYVLGVDIAMHEDWTVLFVFDVTERRFVHYERFNQISWELQVSRIVEMSRVWGAHVQIDATNNEKVADDVWHRVTWARTEQHRFTHLSKAGLINQLSLAIERKEIGLLSEEQETKELQEAASVQLQEFGAYRFEKTPSGRITMNAPAGKHDDIVIAAALAYDMALSCVGGVPVALGTSQEERPTLVGTFGRTPVAGKGKRRRF